MFKSKIVMRLNVRYELKDKNGKLKPLFNENKLGKFFLKFFRKIVKNPIDKTGQIKKGILNHLSAYGLRIPGLTGYWGIYRFESNLVTTVGKALVAGRINGSGTPAAADYIANGIGTTAAAAGDTTLETESAASGLARAQGTVSLVTTTTTNDTARVTKAFSAGASVAITECGLLNAAAAGTLLARQVFSAVNVISGDTWTPTWNIQATV